MLRYIIVLGCLVGIISAQSQAEVSAKLVSQVSFLFCFLLIALNDLKISVGSKILQIKFFSTSLKFLIVFLSSFVVSAFIYFFVKIIFLDPLIYKILKNYNLEKSESTQNNYNGNETQNTMPTMPPSPFRNDENSNKIPNEKNKVFDIMYFDPNNRTIYSNSHVIKLDKHTNSLTNELDLNSLYTEIRNLK